MSRSQDTPYLGERSLDDLARIVVQLLGELSVQRDRVAILEEILMRRGITSTAEIDAFEPSAALEARLEAAREELVESVLGAPLRVQDDVATLVARGAAARARLEAARTAALQSPAT